MHPPARKSRTCASPEAERLLREAFKHCGATEGRFARTKETVVQPADGLTHQRPFGHIKPSGSLP